MRTSPLGNANEAAAWKKVHPHFYISEAALASLEGFPSLTVTVYYAYLESSGNEAAEYVKKLGRECSWAYGMWAKAQRDADKNLLLQDIYNNAAHGSGYAFTRKFLTDYAKANNLKFKP